MEKFVLFMKFCIIPKFPFILLDKFFSQRRRLKSISFIFLSHFHSDHYTGLTKRHFLENQKIVTHVLNSVILIKKFQIPKEKIVVVFHGLIVDNKHPKFLNLPNNIKLYFFETSHVLGSLGIVLMDTKHKYSAVFCPDFRKVDSKNVISQIRNNGIPGVNLLICDKMYVENIIQSPEIFSKIWPVFHDSEFYKQRLSSFCSDLGKVLQQKPSLTILMLVSTHKLFGKVEVLKLLHYQLPGKPKIKLSDSYMRENFVESPTKHEYLKIFMGDKGRMTGRMRVAQIGFGSGFRAIAKFLKSKDFEKTYVVTRNTVVICLIPSAKSLMETNYCDSLTKLSPMRYIFRVAYTGSFSC